MRWIYHEGEASSEDNFIYSSHALLSRREPLSNRIGPVQTPCSGSTPIAIEKNVSSKEH